MRDVDADRRVEQHAVEMAGGPRPGRCHLHARLVRLRIGDELLQIVGGEILARDQERGLIGDEHHRREISGEIVERIFVKRLVDGVGPAAEYELIAVGGGLHHARGAHHSAGAAHVLDEHVGCPTPSNNVRGETGVVPRKALRSGAFVEYCL